MSKLTNALSATRDMHDVPERARAWESLDRFLELGVVGADDVRLWMQRLEEENVAANIVKAGDARRARLLEEQVDAPGMKYSQQLRVEGIVFFYLTYLHVVDL